MLAVVVRCEDVTLRMQRFGLARVLGAALVVSCVLAAVALILHGQLEPWEESLASLRSALEVGSLGLGVMTFVVALGALAAWVLPWTAPLHTGTLEVGEERIVCSHVLFSLRHEDVHAGWYVPGDGEVVLTLGRGDLLRVGGLDRLRAAALLDAIAAGATERALDLALQRDVTTARVVAASLLIPLLIPLLAAASALRSVPVLMAIAAVFAVAWYLVLTRFGAPERVLVGHDGIALEGARGARFIGYSSVSDVAPSIDGVMLSLEDLSRLSVRLLRPRVGRDLDLALRRRDRLLAKIRAELAAFRAGGGDPLGAALLDRGGRSIAAWRASLRDLCSRASGDYRAASLDPDHLVRVLEARDAPPERRLGAALALSSSEDPALRHRVRVFIDTCAGDDLRDAIEEVAEGELDEEKLERAVARMQRP